MGDPLGIQLTDAQFNALNKDHVTFYIGPDFRLDIEKTAAGYTLTGVKLW